MQFENEIKKNNNMETELKLGLGALLKMEYRWGEQFPLPPPPT